MLDGKYSADKGSRVRGFEGSKVRRFEGSRARGFKVRHAACFVAGMRGVNRFQDLIVWQLADELRREVFAATEAGKAARDFKYRDQIRDASSSAARNMIIP